MAGESYEELVDLSRRLSAENEALKIERFELRAVNSALGQQLQEARAKLAALTKKAPRRLDPNAADSFARPYR